ncbi:GTP-binding protein, partial [bacterium]|nr:GTP-binding protein [bacterium]
MLGFSSLGSVDDGKSTLIGRLLYDSKSIFEDQMEAIEIAMSLLHLITLVGFTIYIKRTHSTSANSIHGCILTTIAFL